MQTQPLAQPLPTSDSGEGKAPSMAGALGLPPDVSV